MDAGRRPREGKVSGNGFIIEELTRNVTRMSGTKRRLAAIMFTDMDGYTTLAQRDASTALRMLMAQNQLLRPIFSRYGGTEVKPMGDAFLVEFDSALEAT